MRKIVKKILIIFIILLILDVVICLLKKEHKFEYKIKSADKVIQINEKYLEGKYYFIINLNDINFKFSYNNEFNKSKRVIEKIEYYEKDDMTCIYPILKKDKYLNIICNINNKQYYYDYLSEDLTIFVNNLKEKGYKNIGVNNDKQNNKFDNLKVYNSAIPKDTYIYIWKYNGFYALNNKKNTKLDIFNKDTYLNKLGIKVDKYYILPNYDDDYEYDSLYVINMKNNKKKIINLKESISKDYYINGIIDNNLYIFDKDNVLQYKINPKRKNYEIVGSKDEGGLYYNNKWSTINIYDFKNEELKFNLSNKPEELENYEYVFKYEYNYYYIEDNKLIIYNKVLDNKTYLLDVSNIKSPQMYDGDLYFIKDNILYYYNINKGLTKILEYNELEFNPINRYEVYKK